MSCFGFVALTAIVIGLWASGVTVAYRVSLGSDAVATVQSSKTFDAAVDQVIGMVNGVGVEEVIEQPHYAATLVLDREINTTDEVAQSIIQNSDGIVSAAALTVNGQTVARIEDELLETYLEEYCRSFDLEGADCVSEFVDEVAVESGYYLACDMDDFEIVCALINGLDVRTTVNVSTDIEVPYEVVRKNVSTMLAGNTGVSVQGHSGLTRVVESVTLLNGAEVERHAIETVVVSEPVTEVIEVGTAKTVASPEERAAAYSSGFIFPLPNGVWKISAYYGDGRNHKGIDLCTSYGVTIYAAQAGTVVKSGYDGGYGYSVLIDHGNGLQTRYAHACRLAVKAGDTVSAGDVIAFVGSTGDSTGNHLHFEVLKGGKNVNPASYIGLD